MTNDNTSPVPSFNFFDGLQLLFIGLKLAGTIDWSWWSVMSPTIASLVLGFLSPLVFHLMDSRGR